MQVQQTSSIKLDGFFPGAVDTTMVDGTSYAVPWYVETRMVYYRSDIAAAAETLIMGEPI